MAFQLDSNIPLMAQVPDMGQAIDRGMRVATMADQLQQRREEAPLRKRMLEQRAQMQDQAIQQQTIQTQNAERDQGLANTAMWMSELPKMFKSGDYKGVMEAVNRSRDDELGADQDADVSDHDEIISAIMSGDAADVMRAQNGVDSVLEMAKSRGVFGAQRSASQRDFESKTVGLTEDEKEKARRISLGLDPRAVGSAAQTIAGEGTAASVGESEAIIEKAKASGKAEGKGQGEAVVAPLVAKSRADIEAAVTLAKSSAKDKGETLTELAHAEAALPGLMTTVDQLKELAPLVTNTIAGRMFDSVVKETGFGATEGSTARAKFTALINNQVLPLLKPTFGAAFTVQEGEALRATMGDVNASPDEKIEVLNVFIDNKVREIQTKQRKLDDGQSDTTTTEAIRGGGLSQEAVNILNGLP